MPQANEADNLRVNALITEPRPPIEWSVASPLDLERLRNRWAETEACPVVCASREDGIDQSWLGFDIRTYLRGEQSAGRLSVHSIVIAPGAGLPPHYHDDRETFLIVVEGTPEIGVGSLVETAARFTLAYAPPRTRFSIRNTSDAPVWVNLVYQSAGLERAFADAHELWAHKKENDFTPYRAVLSRYGFRFDDALLENDSLTNSEMPPVEFEFSGEGDLEALREKLFERRAVPRLVHTPESEVALDGPDPGFRKRVLGGDESGGTAMLNFVSRIPPAPKHYQPTEEELFFILDGQLAMTCGTADVILERGALAFAPRNCTHAFGPPAPDIDHKFMTMNTPGGHEHAMAALRAKAKAGLTDQEFRAFSAAGGFIIQ